MAICDFKPYGVIYRITHIESGKVYIGQTTRNLRERWLSHQNQTYCASLHRAIKKHGAEAFVMVEIDRAHSKEQLDELEIHYIALHCSMDRSRGYNLRGGGSFGKHSSESREKMSASVRQAYLDPAFKAKLSAARTGKPCLPEVKAKIAKSNTGKTADVETRKRLSELRTAMWADETSRENMQQASIKARQSEDFKAKTAERSRQQWASEEARQRLLESRAKTQEQGNAARKAAWNDPVKKAARLEKLAATWAAKKASTAA